MEWNKLQDARLAVIAKLVALAPAGYIGRTALMKFCYLLQTVREVPLQYRFTLYSYGPFDADVLSDLGTAENLEAVKSIMFRHFGGYGYQIRAGERARATIDEGIDLLGPFAAADIDWMIQEFGTHGSADLELESTIVFVDREAARKPEQLSIGELASRVKLVKPRFEERYIAGKAEELSAKGLLMASTLSSACA